MLKKIKKLFTPQSNKLATAQRIPVREHGINKRQVSGNALRVIEELQKAGWQAYLVGGGVRDLLLNGHPKDFDIATDATPEQVQSLFRRARIIGRRFKIVHVHMGREMLEVTTFRGAHNESKGKQAVQNDKGMLIRDNVYGDLESDAIRRDFSINALYYDPSTEDIIDYTGAMQDMANKRLSIIGEASARYKEDPVRMLRAIRFQAKLGFTLDEATEAPIKQHAEYLQEIPPARLFEEVLKLFLSGYAEVILKSLHQYTLLKHLVPSAARALDQDNEQFKSMMSCAAHNTDERIASGKRVTPAFIYAAFLWPALQNEIAKLRATQKMSEQELLFSAADTVISEQQKKTSIPKRFSIPMREIWLLQLRFVKRDAKRSFALLDHPKFRAAYDFVLLREQAGEQLNGLGDWWTKFQFASKEEQLTLLNNTSNGKKPRRTRRKPKKTSSE